MKTWTSTLLVTVLFVLSASSQGVELKDIGNINDIKMETLDGQKFNSSQMTNDGPVLIIIWASWLEKQYSAVLDKVNQRYEEWKKETGVKIFGIACDEDSGIHHIKAKINEHQLQYEVLLDDRCQMFHKLKITESVPTIIVTDGKNNVKWTSAGYEPDDENIYIEVLRKLIAK